MGLAALVYQNYCSTSGADEQHIDFLMDEGIYQKNYSKKIINGKITVDNTYALISTCTHALTTSLTYLGVVR